MVNPTKRKIITTFLLSLLITFMHIAGWQISMDYGSSVHQTAFFLNIGVLKPWQCFLWGIVELPVLTVLFYLLFSWLDRVNKDSHKQDTVPKLLWPLSFILLYAIWLFFLWGCYPGYYNYDTGNQLVQVLYDEVPYNAHHPLLHTLFSGGLITLGYHLDSTDLTLGVFLCNAVQMLILSLCLSYSLRFIYKQTRNRILTILAFVFYALCPPIVMLAMSPTKDVLCYAMLLLAFIRMIELFRRLEKDETVPWHHWLILGIFLTLSCLIRKNIVYAVVVFIIFSLLLMKKERKKQLLLYAAVLVTYFMIDKGLLIAFDAIPGSVNEALCVPYQQIARLYTIEGKEAFTPEEYDLLSDLIPPEVLPTCYDPVMADHTKANFNPGLETLMANKGAYFKLWLKKGIQYPKIYLDSILYNTYQAWYPGTLIEESWRIRYFDISDWQYEYGTPHWQGLFDFYESISNGEYAKYPVIRLLFVTGTMLWISLITWFYGIWKKDKNLIIALLLILLVCGTTFLGPVSDIRYYLILFYLMPVCLSFMMQKDK